MPAFSLKNKLFLVVVLSIAVSACGGSSGGGAPSTDPTPETPDSLPTPVPETIPTLITPTPLQVPTASLELIDPTPGAGDEFGSTSIVQLSNGNIVVRDPLDSSVAEHNGAVHLYSPLSADPIASLYGDNANDELGTVVTLVGDAYYVIASPNDDVNGLVDAGSVRLMNGNTGEQVAMVAGSAANALLGSGSITGLGNGNFVVASDNATVNGLVGAGSVYLVNGVTGRTIGEPLVGGAAIDRFGDRIFPLANNNYVMTSNSASNGELNSAGVVMLVNGETGEPIGTPLRGSHTSAFIGVGGITTLNNGNYVVSSPRESNGEITLAGSVRLFNGATGEQIGDTLFGDRERDEISNPGFSLFSGVVALDNNNYIVASPNDDLSRGSVRLFNGTTGAEVGTPILGGAAGQTVVALPGGNYVVGSPSSSDNGLTSNGSVRLIDGATGEQIGPTLAGNNDSDRFGTSSFTNSSIVLLANGHYVVAAALDDENSLTNAGSVRLMNGRTGEQIGDAFVGDNEEDRIGFTSVLALSNNNYAVISENDTVNGVISAGSIRLFNGTTAEAIGTPTVGDVVNDQLGKSQRFSSLLQGRSVAFNNGNYAVLSEVDDENGIVDAGSARLFDGGTGAQIGIISGEVAADMSGAVVQQGVGGDYFILTQRRADKGGLEDSGRVRIVVPE